MTINDQHILMLNESWRETNELADIITLARQIMSNNSGPRNDIHSTQISMLIAETLRSVMKAKTSADILERLLKIVRVGGEP